MIEERGKLIREILTFLFIFIFLLIFSIIMGQWNGSNKEIVETTTLESTLRMFEEQRSIAIRKGDTKLVEMINGFIDELREEMGLPLEERIEPKSVE